MTATSDGSFLGWFERGLFHGRCAAASLRRLRLFRKFFQFRRQIGINVVDIVQEGFVLAIRPSFRHALNLQEDVFFASSDKLVGVILLPLWKIGKISLLLVYQVKDHSRLALALLPDPFRERVSAAPWIEDLLLLLAELHRDECRRRLVY